ncbi:MAG: GlcG/HbpS family heme-binding protein [Gemmatirosa sp.]
MTARTFALPALLVALTALGVATPAAAQTRSVPALTLAGAQRALAASEAESRRNAWSMCIVVVDAAGDIMTAARMDGAIPVLCDVAERKARTAARYARPSKVWGESLRNGSTAILALPDMLAVEGGIPITVNGTVVGAVGVSGSASANDAAVADAGARAVTP